MRYDCDAALVINSSSPCATVSVPMTVLCKFFQHSNLLIIYYREKTHNPNLKDETHFRMLNKASYVADLLPCFMNLTLQRTCHLGGLFLSQKEQYTGTNCQNTGIILRLEERKRPDFFKLYILTFYMQQKKYFNKYQLITCCYAIIFKIPLSNLMTLFCYLFFKSCHSFFVLLVQCVRLMLQRFLLMQSNKWGLNFLQQTTHMGFQEKKPKTKQTDSLLNIFRKAWLIKKPED